MLNAFLKWTRARDAEEQIEFPELEPEVGFYAVGDIHGRADLLEQILVDFPSDLPLIFVGDYIDRGDNSSKVLDILRSSDEFICLKGNHEEMLLQFVEEPGRYGSRWLRYGGMQTLASFGIGGVTENSSRGEFEAVASELAGALGDDGLNWLSSLPSSYADGNVVVVHAGADPAVPIDQQSEQTLIWGHERFEKDQRTDGVWIVHGHTIVPEAISQNGRISIDTGAYATGKLSACRVSDGLVLFDHTQ